jgi:hypothetical protein
MAFVAHFDLELPPCSNKDVKTAFLNGDLQEEVYMDRPIFWLLAGGLRAFSVQVKEVDIRTSLPVSGTSNSMMPMGLRKRVLISVYT